MNFEDIMLNLKSQTKKSIYFIFHLSEIFRIVKFIVTGSIID